MLLNINRNKAVPGQILALTLPKFAGGTGKKQLSPASTAGARPSASDIGDSDLFF
jgi:hypothetical protein